jgi:hypothetical protein
VGWSLGVYLALCYPELYCYEGEKVMKNLITDYFRFHRLILMLSALFILYGSLGYSITLPELLSEKGYDQQIIEVSGEIIGPPIKKNNGWFINVDIGGGVIGVFTKKLPKLKHYGSYKEKGDVVKVQGIFYNTCKEHRGETDIHSQGIEVIKMGETIPHPIKKANAIAAILLSFLAILFVLLYRRFSGKSAS